MDAISSIGQVVGKLLPAALTGGGFINNLLTQRKTNERQNFVENAVKNFPQYSQKFIQPLSKGLTSNVGNQVQGYLGERGLSMSPTITADVESQALAPFVQQNQQTGIQAALGSLGIMPGAPGQMTDTSGPLALLLKQLRSRPITPAPQPQNTNAAPPDPFNLPAGSAQQPDWGSILGIGTDAMPQFGA